MARVPARTTVTIEQEVRGNMNDRKRLLKLTLGVLITLCLCAFAASTAQAEGEWRINGAKLTGEEAFTGLIATTEEYLFLIPSLNISIHCKIKQWVGVVLLASGESHGAHRYEGCNSFSAGKEVASCNPGAIELKFKSLLILHEKKTYILFEPREKGSFGVIKFPELCAFTETGSVSGSYVMECVEPSPCETEALVHPMVPASAALFPSDGLKFGTSPLTLDGRDITEPGGPSFGKPWSAVG
jgi:hypothetical protein